MIIVKDEMNQSQNKQNHKRKENIPMKAKKIHVTYIG